MQQQAVVFECRSGNDAVIGLADGDALLSQLAINVSGPNEYSFGYWQHDQGLEIAPNPSVCSVIGNALENPGQYDSAQSQIFVVEDEQRG